ncbi:CxC ATPase DNA modification system associated small protein [Streptomyces chartreusis]|uniref:CxC ATPase DNA modification system associated small protein n=1 Tax=Streptomyces chartreusis TaxID=1969 RepID=UPI003862EB33
MSLDPKIVKAIEEAVAEADQEPALARRLVAWMQAITSGSEDPNDVSRAERHLELLYEGTTANRGRGGMF